MHYLKLSVARSRIETRRFLCRKDMEMACFKLSIASNSQAESRSDDAFNANYSLMNEIMDDFVRRARNYKMDATAETSRRFHRYTLKASMSGNTEQSADTRLVASGLNHAVPEILAVNHRSGSKVRKGKALMYTSEVEQLNDRLRILEEEAETMKQAFLESMKERKKLMNEVCQEFRVIQHCLQSRKQVTGDESTDRVLIANPRQIGRAGTGLSQVLQKQSNPSHVSRDLRATMVAIEDPDDMYEFPE